jgi:DNA-binding GntR family transcriptional regulator
MEKTNQAERAYQELRRILLEHGYASGAKLSEIGCSERLGVNRGDARMAMARLYSEGLLIKGDKCGYRIPTMTAEQMQEIYEVRLLLETVAAKLAVKRFTKTDIHRMSSFCDDMEMMANKGYDLGVCEADLRFHEALIQAAHNSKLTQIYQRSNLPLTFDETISSDRNKELFQENVKQHRMILAALEKRNEKQVIQLLEEGINKVNTIRSKK